MFGVTIKHSDGYDLTFETHSNNSESVAARIAAIKEEVQSEDFMPLKKFEIENDCGFLYSFGKSTTWYQFRAVVNFNTVKHIVRFNGPNSTDMSKIKMNFDAVCSAKHVPQEVVIDSLVLEQYKLVIPVSKGAKLNEEWSEPEGSQIDFNEELSMSFSMYSYGISAEETLKSMKETYQTDENQEFVLETSDSFIMRKDDVFGDSKYAMMHIKVVNGITYTFSDDLDTPSEADARFLLECAQNTRVILPPPPEPLTKKEKLKVFGLYGLTAAAIIVLTIVLGSGG